MHTTIHTTTAALSFKEIEKSVRQHFVSARAAKQRTLNELHNAPPPKVRKAGFIVDGKITEDSITLDKIHIETGRLETINQQLGIMDALSTDLLMLGLPPIAILPKPLWRELTKREGVYRFEHFDDTGCVPAKPLGNITALRTRLNFMSMSKIVATLWPDFHDQVDKNEHIRVAPSFLQAPKHFQENLVRLTETNYPVHIAAVPEAITVDPNEVLNARVQKKSAPPPVVITPPTPDDDPILYTSDEFGYFVAILDYFGHFPKEELLVERAREWYASFQRQRAN